MSTSEWIFFIVFNIVLNVVLQTLAWKLAMHISKKEGDPGVDIPAEEKRS